MTFTQIEYFLEVARCENFTKASKNLYISQQVASKQVHALEKELNLQLFNRSNRQITLTDSGKILFDAWSKMLEENQTALEKAIDANNIQKTKIRLGINEVSSIIDYVMPKMIECNNNNPKIEFEYELGSATYLIDLLEKNKIDMMISFSSEVEENTTFNYLVLDTMKIDLAIIISKNHPLASKELIDLKDLKDETIFIMKESYSKDAGKKILTHFEEEGFKPKKIKGFDNLNNMEIALNLCEGVTVAYTALFRNKNGQLKFYPNQGTKGYKKVDLSIAWKKDQFEKYAKEFM